MQDYARQQHAYHQEQYSRFFHEQAFMQCGPLVTVARVLVPCMSRIW